MAGIEFKTPKTPFSPQYDDFYFAHEYGIEESSYVYLEGAEFLESVQSGRDSITVAEIGFGVGLNFILTLKTFLEHARPGQHLHYWSAEKFPVPLADLQSLYQMYPDLLPTAEHLFAHYPLLTPGVHSLRLGNLNVTLNLLIGDALTVFQQLDFKANHWYWDGFSPQKNPDAFSKELFEEVVRLSAPLSLGASFTAAGWVRRTLESLGFEIRKRPGFRSKRECIQAIYQGAQKSLDREPWFSRTHLKTLKKGDTIAVLGAGLAGSAVARALAELGYPVKVFDPKGIAERASSNTVGLYNVQLSKLPNPISRFSQASLAQFLSELKELKIPTRKGILREEDFTIESLKTSGYPEDFYHATEAGVKFPDCGMINPRTLCIERLNHPLIQFYPFEVVQTQRLKGEWVIYLKDKTEEIKVVHLVYALGSDLSLGETTLKHPLLTPLPMRPIRGQTLLIQPTEKSQSLSETLVKEGYASPVSPEVTGHSYQLLGATYQAKQPSENQEALDTEKLIQDAQSKWEVFEDLDASHVVSTKVGFRCSTPDKLPLIGPLCNENQIRENYARAMKGSSIQGLPSLEASEGEWILMGLGSRGITFSSLAAQLLVAFMTGSPLPLEHDLVTHLHPARFYLRSLRKTTP